MLGFGKIKKKVFGTANDRLIKATQPIIDKINALEPEYSALDDAGLIDQDPTNSRNAWRPRAKAWNAFLPEAFANCREGARDARWACGRSTCS